MKKEAADFMIRVTLKATSEMTNMIPFAKEFCDNEEEYEHYRKAFTSIVKIASVEIFSSIFSSHPELEAEIDTIIGEFGRLP